MKDRSVEYPNRYRLQKVDGTDDIYDLVPAPGEVTDEGTFINKATLLKDATAALYGLGGDAVPDDVLALLESLVSTAQSAADTAQSTANARARIQAGSYTGTGTYGTSNPNNLTFDFAPKFVVVIPGIAYYSTYRLIWAGGGYGTPFPGSGDTINFTLSGSTLSWLSTNDAASQMNAKNIYYYIAIG